MSSALAPGRRLGRHRICTLAGTGGMGRVYRAWDTDRSRFVALKTLHHLGRDSLARVRAEFRALETHVHPNIVTFYELGLHGEIPYYVMRWVSGTPLLESADATETRAGPFSEPARAAPGPTVRETGPEIARWLLELADAVESLHERGLLHLDIKPTNLMIDRSGGLVLVDFGLATRLERDTHSARAPLEATPAYSPPEQREGGAVSAASDWFAVGATLHHALVGAPPSGPHERDSLEAWGSLGRLCADLLEPEAEKRAGAAAIRARLGGAASLPPRPKRPEASFVGRTDFVASLEAELVASDARHVVLLLRGPAGVGRTVALNALGVRVRASEPGAIVAYGRSRECEDTPFGVLDELMAGIEGVEGAQRPDLGSDFQPSLEAGDGSAETRALIQSGARLADWLAECSRGEPVTLLLDDFQYCDRDSLRLLIELFTSPGAPPLRAMVALRDSPEAAPVVAELERWLLGLPAGVRYLERELAPLGARAAEEIARAVLGSGANAAAIDALARASQGSPGLLHELAAAWLESGGDQEGWLASRDAGELLRGRIATLSPCAREYLEVASVASDLAPQGLLRAALTDPAGEPEALAELRSRGWLATRGPSLFASVELAAPLRRTMLSLLPRPREREIHIRLARAIRSAHLDGAGLARHLSLAGLRKAAAAQAIAAGDAARARLAFNRAADAYRSALDWGAAASRPRVQGDLARMLAASGRGAEAASAWTALAEQSSGENARELRLRAARELLVSGNFETGRAALLRAAQEHGVVYPRSAVSALVRTLYGLLRIPLRHAEPRTPASGARALERARLATAAFRGLMPIDPARAAYFAVQAVRLGARSGSPAQYAEAAIELACGVLAPAGGRLARRATPLLDEATRIGAALGDGAIGARADLARSTILFWKGRWAEAHELAARASNALHALGVAAGFEQNISNLVVTRSLEELGRWNDAAERTAAMYRDALRRNDRYALVTASLNYGMISLARGDAAGAHAWATRATESWPGRGMQVQHVYALRVHCYAHLFAGEPDPAGRLIDQAWDRIRAGMHLRVPAARVDLLLMRARILLHRAAASQDPGRLVAHARTCWREIGALRRRPDVRAHLLALEGCAAALEGDREKAMSDLEEAALAFEGARLLAFADACRLLLDAAPEESRKAAKRLEALGVARPAEWSRIFVPLQPILRGENPK